MNKLEIYLKRLEKQYRGSGEYTQTGKKKIDIPNGWYTEMRSRLRQHINREIKYVRGLLKENRKD